MDIGMIMVCFYDINKSFFSSKTFWTLIYLICFFHVKIVWVTMVWVCQLIVQLHHVLQMNISIISHEQLTIDIWVFFVGNPGICKNVSRSFGRCGVPRGHPKRWGDVWTRKLAVDIQRERGTYLPTSVWGAQRYHHQWRHHRIRITWHCSWEHAQYVRPDHEVHARLYHLERQC